MASTAIPSGRFDSTFGFLSQGYPFIGRECDRLGSDAFRTRVMLKPVICARGAEWAELFYDGERFTRRGAIFPTTLRLLQDVGSVQSLDGPAHRHRKALFVSLLMDRERVKELVAIFESEWKAAEPGWRGHTISLLEKVNPVLTRTACRWCGLDYDLLGGDTFAAELDAMVANAGRLDPRVIPALMRRRKAEEAVEKHLSKVRSDRDDTSPVSHIAGFIDANEQRLDTATAAVELINILRPILAVGRYIVYCALALEEQVEWRAQFARQDFSQLEEFVEEVRRFYPFFPFVGGTTRRVFAWQGTEITLGTWVLFDLYGTNHDPRRFPTPDAFRPGRGTSWAQQGYDFVPQGAGRTEQTHRCPGELATVELMKTAVGLLSRLDAEAVGPRDLKLTHYPPMPPGGLRLRVAGSAGDQP